MRKLNGPFIKVLTNLVLLLFLFSTPGEGEIIDRVVAIVNEEVITLSELLQVAAQTQSNSSSSLFSSENYRQLIEKIIDQKLIEQESLQTEIRVSDREVDQVIENFKKRNNITTPQLQEALQQQGLTWEKYREEMRAEIKRNQFVVQKIQSQVNISEKEVKSYFRKHRKDYFQPAQVKIEQIFFPFPSGATPEIQADLARKAEEAVKRLTSGEDFRKVAQESNLLEEKSSYDLGYFKKGELVALLDEAAFSLKIGEISNIITTNKGHFIVRVLDRTEEKTKTLDEVREEITNNLFQKQMEREFDEWIKELHSNAYIEVKSD